jgi:hypothetical protein
MGDCDGILECTFSSFKNGSCDAVSGGGNVIQNLKSRLQNKTRPHKIRHSTMMASLIPNKRKLDELMPSSASTSLTDLSDELLTLVLGNLDFRKRSVTRRVCRTLCRVADSLPPPEELQVNFIRFEDRNLADRVPRQLLLLGEWGHYLVECNHSTTTIDILLDHNHIGPEEEYLLQLRAIRPVQLKMDAPSGISSQLLHRVADQVAGTVTSLSITHLDIDSPLALYDAFSPFRNNGRLTDLRLEAFSRIRSILFATTTVHSLVRLDLVLSASAFPEWNTALSEQTQGFGLELTALQSLPCLRELSISCILPMERSHMLEETFEDLYFSDDFVTGFILGCSAIHQLRFLSWVFLFDGAGEETYQAFALMLSRLENLEQLYKLVDPPENLWSHVLRAGGHSKLQKISIFFSKATESKLEATVRAIVRDFPALVTLELELLQHHCVELDRTAEILAGLQSHSSMTNVVVSLKHASAGLEIEIDDFLRMLQKDLGPQISVCGASTLD